MKKLLACLFLSGLVGCAPMPQNTVQFHAGDRVRHVVSKQEGIITWGNGYYYTVRLSVEKVIITDGLTVKTVELQELGQVRGFELEKSDK